MRDPRDDVSRRTLFGIRTSAWLELAVLFGAALAVDRFLLDGDCFAGLSLHPFWAVILLMAAQYGTGEALLAAGISTAALLLLRSAPDGIALDRYAVLYERMRTPLLWMVAAAVLGEIRRRHAQREAILDRTLAGTRETERFLREAAVTLESARRSLEIEMAGLPATLLGVFQAAPGLQTAGIEWVPREALRLVDAALRPDQCSVFLKFGTEWRLTESMGWGDRPGWAKVLPHTHGLAAGFEAGATSLSVLDDEGVRRMAGEGLVAAALRDSRTGLLIGMIKIEAWDRAALHAGSVQLLGSLANWVAAAWMSARAREEPAERSGTTVGGYGGV